MKTELTYTDEKGNTLYGFSQTSLDRNTHWTKLLFLVVGILAVVMSAFFFYVLWLTFYVIRHDVLNNIVRSCIHGG